MPDPQPTASSAPAADGSYEQLLADLNAHGKALVRGDEQGWLAPVDPKAAGVGDYFRRLYTTLRTLQVTSWTYQSAFPAAPILARTDDGDLIGDLDLDIGYCLLTTPCPTFQRTQQIGPVGGPHPAHMRLPVTVEHRDGRWLIVNTRPQPRTKAWAGSDLPWHNADLTFATGDRVTVGAPPSQAHRLPEVLAAAERAAAITDRFARHLDTPGDRYLLFLAGEPEWGRWYGQGPTHAVGYAMTRGTVGVDVVLRMRDLNSPTEMLEVLRHEFGHVITTHGTAATDLQGQDLIEEGIAEYTAHAPRPATTNPHTAAIRRWTHRNMLSTTLENLPPLPATASAVDRNAFYAVGHLLVDCLADTYGEPAMFAFIDRTIRKGEFNNPAARAAFGKPWQTVEQTCLARIRTTVRN